MIETVRARQLTPRTRLTDDLGLAPNKVAQAYPELERDGVIETRERNGSFMAATGDATYRQAQHASTAYPEHRAQLDVK